MICLLEDKDLPETPEPWCCEGAASMGPGRCTCWEPVYDLDQQEPRTQEPAGVRPEMCVDCAYRPGSPERRGEEDYKGDQDLLDALVVTGRPFWCHQGVRRPVKYRHPCGMEIEGHPAEYRPPLVAGRPYKADGSPSDLCGGWAARRLAHLGNTTGVE